MNYNPVGWFEIPVNDMDRAKNFYAEVFKHEMMDLPMPPEAGLMCAFKWHDNASGAAGALVKHEQATPSAVGTLVYFSCEDCATEESRVEAAGGKVVQPKFSIGEYGFISLAMDTEGNMIGLHSQK